MHLLNKYFDNIYVLYIYQREIDKIKPKLLKHNVEVQYYEGYNGIVDNTGYNKYKHMCLSRKKNEHKYKIRLLTPGAYGHIKSFINILTDAINKKYKKILILEPDIYFCMDFEDKCEKYLKMDYKILYLGAYQYKFFAVPTWKKIEKNNINMISDGYYHPYNTLGTFGIAMDSSIFNEYKNLLSNMNMSSDTYMTLLQQKYYHDSYVCYPNLICCDLTRSSTTKSRKQIDNMSKLRWNIIPYELIDTYVIKTVYKHKDVLPNTKYIITLSINSIISKNFSITIENIITIKHNNINEYTNHRRRQTKPFGKNNVYWQNKLSILITTVGSSIKIELKDIFINEYKVQMCKNSIKPKTKAIIKTIIRPTVKPASKPTVKLTNKPTVKLTNKSTSKSIIKLISKSIIKPTSKPTVKPTMYRTRYNRHNGFKYTIHNYLH